MDTMEKDIEELHVAEKVHKGTKPAPKRRNNEKRKEKSRDAARCRRSRETEIFTDLSSALPLTQEQVSQLDKASIMRLAISYLKVRDMIKLVPDMKCKEKNRNDSKILEVDQSVNTTESVFLKTIDGFVMALSTEGDFVYVSENISEYLGINQIDLMGQNIYDYSHPCDHGEIKEMLSIKNKENYSNEDTKSYFLRLKCTLTSKGRSVNLKSASYKVIHCTGHMLHSTDDTEELESNSDLHHCMVAVGQPIPHPSNIEAPLPHQTFFTKHSLDMKFTYADEKMLEFLGYNSEDLVGKSVYEYHHATDMNVISTAYKSLFSKGQCETNRYRFLAKNGGFVWVLTQATLIYDKGQKPESVVCVNFIISGIECKDEIYAAFQLESSASSSVAVVEETRESIETPIDEDVFVPLTINTQEIDEERSLEVLQKQQQQPLIVTAKLFANCDVDDAEDAHTVVSNTIRPQTATSKIFAPRTEEMNKGFLTFSDEDGLTLLKDEPDDLTHLAPVAGDVVSLETHPYLTEMLDEFLLKDGFCPLLAEEQPDPFIAYRGSCEPSPQLLSPNILKNSECSLTSLNSPTDSLSEEDQMTSFIGFPMEEDPELVAKAPYISMAMGDDLPLMNSDDLMWSTVNTNNNRRLQQIDPTPASTSSLAELLSASVNKHSIKDDMPLSMDTRLLDRIDSYNKSTTQWNNDKLNNNNSHQNNGVKRNCSPYDISNKRIKSEPKDMMSSELLQQLISNNTQNNRRSNNSKNKSWAIEKNCSRKAACVSQPSDSVLMNLLDTTEQTLSPPEKTIDQQKFNLQSATQLATLQQKQREQQDLRMQQVRKTSTSLLDPDALGIPSLLDLTQQDYEVNAPVSNYLLQGEDLIIALNNDSVLGDGVI